MVALGGRHALRSSLLNTGSSNRVGWRDRERKAVVHAHILPPLLRAQVLLRTNSRDIGIAVARRKHMPPFGDTFQVLQPIRSRHGRSGLTRNQGAIAAHPYSRARIATAWAALLSAHSLAVSLAAHHRTFSSYTRGVRASIATFPKRLPTYPPTRQPWPSLRRICSRGNPRAPPPSFNPLSGLCCATLRPPDPRPAGTGMRSGTSGGVRTRGDHVQSRATVCQFAWATHQ